MDVPRIVMVGTGVQSRFIYFPRNYSAPVYQSLLGLVSRTDFTWEGMPLTAFAFPKVHSSRPPKIWWFFGGNGSLALDWIGLLEELDTGGNLCVLVDYPGYGFNPGKPSPHSIRSTIDALEAGLRERLGLSREDLWTRSNVVGHSLGAAVALDTTVRFGARLGHRHFALHHHEAHG